MLVCRSWRRCCGSRQHLTNPRHMTQRVASEKLSLPPLPGACSPAGRHTLRAPTAPQTPLRSVCDPANFCSRASCNSHADVHRLHGAVSDMLLQSSFQPVSLKGCMPCVLSAPSRASSCAYILRVAHCQAIVPGPSTIQYCSLCNRFRSEAGGTEPQFHL